MVTSNKERFFREFFWYWAGRFSLNKDIKIKITKEELKAAADDSGKYLYYNKKEIDNLTTAELIDIALHEIGHLINNLNYNTEEEKINAEYAAENFAITNIKAHYIKYLNRVLESLYMEIKTSEETDIYKQAYMKIPEFKKYYEKKGVK
jgi:predicted metal-dependent peptidase